MNKILLEIKGIQRIDTQRDKMELTTAGTFEETAEAYVINYTEEQEPPTPPIDVCVKISKDEKAVEMTRTGAFNSCLIIEKSKRNLCHYGTEFGDILMGISGHTIEGECTDEKGSFIFTYDIDMNGALVSRNEVRINFRSNQE
ncbi:MAG: DUF1934 domain-containing protein [Eubacterium sp.]|nr:DUF1934 domain-containing protein [Eubacterium sp.]